MVNSLFRLRRATGASAHPTGRRLKNIRAGPYRLRTCYVTCSAARLAFVIGLSRSVAHSPASWFGSPLRAIFRSDTQRCKHEKSLARRCGASMRSSFRCAVIRLSRNRLFGERWRSQAVGAGTFGDGTITLWLIFRAENVSAAPGIEPRETSSITHRALNSGFVDVLGHGEATASSGNYCGMPSMAKVRNFAYFSPIFLVSTNAADLRYVLYCSTLSHC